MSLSLSLTMSLRKVEPSRTNLLLYSEQFDNAAWAKVNSTVTANAATAPDESSTADKLVSDGTSGTGKRLHQSVTKDAAAKSYAFTIYGKDAEWPYIAYQVDDGASTNKVAGWFRISTGGASATTGGTFANGVAQTSALPDGWFRCILTFTSNTSTTIRVNLYASPNGSVLATGDSTSGIYLWGAQLEEGAFPTSYIETTSQAVTRP